MPPHNRKLKLITLDIGGENFEIQCKTWNLTNNTAIGDKQYTFAPDGEFTDEVDPDYTLALTFFADWRVDGVSDFLTAHDGETLPFQLDHHPDIVAEHVRWTGNVTIMAPTVGGDARVTEETAVEYAVIGKPVYSRP